MAVGAYSSPAARQKILLNTFQSLQWNLWSLWSWNQTLRFHQHSVSSREQMLDPVLPFIQHHVVYIIALQTLPHKVSWLPTSSAEHQNRIPMTCCINLHGCRDVGCSSWYSWILWHTVRGCWSGWLSWKHRPWCRIGLLDCWNRSQLTLCTMEGLVRCLINIKGVCTALYHPSRSSSFGLPCTISTIRSWITLSRTFWNFITMDKPSVYPASSTNSENSSI